MHAPAMDTRQSRSSHTATVAAEQKEEEHEAAAATSPLHTAAASSAPVAPQQQPPSRWSRLCRSLHPRSWRRPHSLLSWPLALTYFLITFAQELPTTAIGLMLANELHFGPAETSQYYAATFVPWTIRPVYAFLSDQVPIFAYRRRPYFLVCAVLACVAQVCLALWGRTQNNFLVLAVATQLFIAVCEVACDSLSVEWGNELALRVCALQIKAASASTQAAQQPPETMDPVAASDEDAPTWQTLSLPRVSSLKGEWSRPLLSPAAAAAASDSAPFFRPASPCTPLFVPPSPPASVTMPAHVATFRSAQHSRYNALTADREVDAEQAAADDVALRSVAAATPLPSPQGSHSASPSPFILPPPSPSDSPVDRFASGVLAHLIAGGTDPATLTPLLLKSLIQSECMSVRTAGSVVSSALSTWVMLVWLSPRQVLLWSSGAFLLSMCSMAAYQLERKVGRGYFGLADTGMHTPLTPGSSGADYADATRAPLVAGTVYSIPIGRAVPALADPATTGDGYAAVRSHEEEQPILPSSNSSVAAGTSDASSAAVAASSASDPHVCMLELSRWKFLWRKLLSLLRAIRLLLGPLLFIFLVNVVPTSEDAYFNYLYSDYWGEFSNAQFSLFNFLGLLGSLIGCAAYQRFIAGSRIGLQAVFCATTIAGALVGCTQIVFVTRRNQSLGMDDETWIIVDSMLVSGVQILAQLPTVILAAHYAPRGLGLEASCFSLFATAAHVGSLASAELTASMTRHLGITQSDWSALWKLIVICNALALMPLILMPMLLHPTITGKSEHEQLTAKAQENEKGPQWSSSAPAA